VQSSSPPLPYPLDIDQTKNLEFRKNGADTSRSMHPMAELMSCSGSLYPDKDAVAFEHYDEVKPAPRELKEKLAMIYGKNDADKSTGCMRQTCGSWVRLGDFLQIFPSARDNA